MRKGAFLVVIILSACNALAQSQRDPIEFSAGVEFKALVPVSFFTMNPIILADTADNFSTEVSYLGGFGFGATIRAKITDFWNVETGIGYTRRNYRFNITDESVNFEGATDVSVIGYELPVKGLIYIQMGQNLFMDVALGVSVDFFASDLEVLERNFTVRAFKSHWLQGSIIGNVGVEYRTDSDGIFYIGGNIHQPFNDILLFGVAYYEGGIPPPATVGLSPLDGAYASLDLRYFFPVKKDKGSKINRVIPNWGK